HLFQRAQAHRSRRALETVRGAEEGLEQLRQPRAFGILLQREQVRVERADVLSELQLKGRQQLFRELFVIHRHEGELTTMVCSFAPSMLSSCAARSACRVEASVCLVTVSMLRMA